MPLYLYYHLELLFFEFFFARSFDRRSKRPVRRKEATSERRSQPTSQAASSSFAQHRRHEQRAQPGPSPGNSPASVCSVFASDETTPDSGHRIADDTQPNAAQRRKGIAAHPTRFSIPIREMTSLIFAILESWEEGGVNIRARAHG